MSLQIFTDGASRGNPGNGASGALLFNEENKLIDFSGKYFKNITNNQAEYNALIIGLKLAIKHRKNEDVVCYLDSELVVKQMNGEYKVKDEKIKILKSKVDTLLKELEEVQFIHVIREQNKLADKLVNLILDTNAP